MTALEQPLEIRTSGFFILRTPLLPFDEILKLAGGSESVVRERLRALVLRPEVREALFVGSPDLEESLDLWLLDPASERGRRIELAIVRYVSRMCGRATPFGLFAGWSTGRVGSSTSLTLGPLSSYGRHTRLDMEYISALVDAVGKDRDTRRGFRHHPNSSLYEAAGRLHYAEAKTDKAVRSYQLVAVERSDYLESTLARASLGARPDELAAALQSDDPEISLEEAVDYVDDLIDSQILTSDLAPCVTGSEPIDGLTAALRGHERTAPISDGLEEAQRSIESLDRESLGVAPGRYRAIAQGLKGLPAPFELSHMFQVDMYKSAPDLVLGGEPLAQIQRGVAALHRLMGRPRSTDLDSFREAFEQRYQGREVPLVEALDDEIGIGYGPQTGAGADASPLLERILFSNQAVEPGKWEHHHTGLLRRLDECIRRRSQELVLEDSDIENLRVKDPLPLPDAFIAYAAVGSASRSALARGDCDVLLTGVYGPSGAPMLGRFCQADRDLADHVRRHIQEEESLQPDAIFAEIVHLPEGRTGNIICRPLLRDYEIPFLGRSGAPIERQIPITDLFVSVVEGRIVLRSARLQKRVIPRLSNAHNYRLRSLRIYQFLCMMQSQGMHGMSWNWGPLEGARFLPRVRIGRVVLCRARWHLREQEIRVLRDWPREDAGDAALQWREREGLPRFGAVADGDNILLVDFENPLSLRTFLTLVKNRDAVTIEEVFPPPERLCATGPEGRFVHELMIPFVRVREPNVDAPRRHVPAAEPAVRALQPGSEWISAKLYCGTAAVDTLLRRLVRPLVETATASGAADRWFFVRYADPHRHLRLRLHGDPRRLAREVLPQLCSGAAELMQENLVWSFQLDTYEREIERYGGPLGILLAEQIFHHDSETVLQIVEALAGDEANRARWRIALFGVHDLLASLGLEWPDRMVVIRGMRDGFAREFHAGKVLNIQIGDTYRKERKSLELLLEGSLESSNVMEPALALLRGRSERLAPLAAELRTSERGGKLSQPLAKLAESYVHMHMNRILRSSHREQELIIYDFLTRLYRSREVLQPLSHRGG